MHFIHYIVPMAYKREENCLFALLEKKEIKVDNFYKKKSPVSNQKHLKLSHDTHWIGRAHVLRNLASFSTRSCGFCSKLLLLSIICRRERTYKCRCSVHVKGFVKQMQMHIITKTPYTQESIRFLNIMVIYQLIKTTPLPFSLHSSNS